MGGRYSDARLCFKLHSDEESVSGMQGEGIYRVGTVPSCRLAGDGKFVGDYTLPCGNDHLMDGWMDGWRGKEGWGWSGTGEALWGVGRGREGGREGGRERERWMESASEEEETMKGVYSRADDRIG